MDGEGLEDMVRPASAGKSRVAIYFFAYVGVLLLAVLVLDAALWFPRQSLAYEWMNRIGMFVVVVIIIGLSAWMEWGSTRPMAQPHARFLRWYMRILGVLLPVLFAIKAWKRILEAFWLR